MTHGSHDPLADTSRLIVDGNNLLHAMRRGSGAAPPAALIGRLRAAIPAPVVIDVVLDGPPDPGLGSRRVASGVALHHSGRGTADGLIAMLVGGPQERPDPLGASGTLVVTDDAGLRGRIRSLGARTAGTGWLIGRLERVPLSAPAAGSRRPPSGPPPDAGDEEDERKSWKPGRGATTKRGNPRRTPRHRRRPPLG